ncbi:type II and III secretion system protein [Alteromonas sp. Mex14]|nr:type II and III secretion system protein [Alteromonas sp. Mex14]
MQHLSPKLIKSAKRAIAISIASSLLLSCASFKGPAYQLAQKDKETFTKPLRDAKQLTDENGEALIQPVDDATPQGELSIIRPPELQLKQASEEADNEIIESLSTESVRQQSFDNISIPAFINEAFGNQLGLDFVIQPSISQAPDLISMRINSQMSQKDFYALTTKTLNQYGVTTYIQDDVLVFDYSSNAADNEVPLIASGRALPEVPSGSRPVFQIYPLTSVSTPEVRGLLSQIFAKNSLDIIEDISRNALILKGSRKKVKEAVEAITILDRPAMAGMESAIIRPVINSVEELSASLFQILETEGYKIKNGSSNSPIRLLPLSTTGQLIVFAKSKEVLDYIIDWAKTLESQRQSEVQKGLFSYQVQSTQATHIVDLLRQLGVAQGGVGAAATNNESGNAPNVSSNVGSSNAQGRYAVDEQLNTILFSGSGKDWLQALNMIKRLDKPAPSVMIEVILAEVTLDEEDQSAIEWLAKGAVDSFDVVGKTLGGLGYTGAGLDLTFSNAGDTRLALNFLYRNTRSTIRSRPRVMVKSGQEASIDVGDRVPIITSNVQSTVTNNASIVQQVSYVDTGVLLDIKPTVHATGFVDIEISQELSEATIDENPTINSPTISTRSINTTLTLRDGGSVLIGGLIRSSDSEAETGVPVLGKLPGIGKLFRGDSGTQRRTELMVMIIPYILNGPDEAESLRDELQKDRMQIIYPND